MPCIFTKALILLLIRSGAGEGNRTLISGLGSPHSTTEPHPPPPDCVGYVGQARLRLFEPGWHGPPQMGYYQIGRRLATGLQLLASRLKPMNGAPQLVFNDQLTFDGHHFAAVQFAHVKTVNGRAALGHNARAGDVEPESGKSLRDGIEQTQTVLGLDFDERAGFRSLLSK